MSKPICITLIFGFISSLCAVVLPGIPALYWGWPVVVKIFLLLNLFLYTIFLCRLTSTGLGGVMFPLLLVSGAALWPNSSLGFLLLALAVLSWIRSGICWRDMPVRAYGAELVILLCGGGVILLWWPGPRVSLPMVVWVFFLVQTLYFFIVPETGNESTSATDSFELASHEVERLLRKD